MHLELHYLPSIEYFALLFNNNGEIEFEINENYVKQSYRNRASILTANGILDLTIPIVHNRGKKQLMKDVKINYEENWLKQHRGAIVSAYAKSGYYDYFSEEIFEIYNKKPNFLVDLNLAFIELFFKFMSLEISCELTAEFNLKNNNQWYNFIHPKRKEDWTGSILKHYSYFQCFGDNFIPQLSVLDLVMNQGPDSKRILCNLNLN